MQNQGDFFLRHSLDRKLFRDKMLHLLNLSFALYETKAVSWDLYINGAKMCQFLYFAVPTCLNDEILAGVE